MNNNKPLWYILLCPYAIINEYVNYGLLDLNVTLAYFVKIYAGKIACMPKASGTKIA